MAASFVARSCIVLLALALAGCATSDASNGSSSLLGGFAPRDRGANGPAAQSIVAALGGGLIGPQLGQSIDERDRRKALEAEYRALEYSAAGQPVPWKSVDGTIAGQVTAYQPYSVGSQDCRQYSHVVTAVGETRTARGTACRNDDGSWTPLT